MHTWAKFSASQLKYTILLFDIVFGKLIWQIALQCFHWSHGSMNFLQFTYCLSLLKYICHFVYKLNMYLPAAKVITLPFANHILPKIKLFKFSPRDHRGLNPWILHLKNIIRDIIIVFPTPNSLETLSLLHIFCSFQSFFILLLWSLQRAFTCCMLNHCFFLEFNLGDGTTSTYLRLTQCRTWIPWPRLLNHEKCNFVINRSI